MFAGLNFRGFRGLPGHPRKLNPRIIVVLRSDYKMADSTCSAHVNVAKHDNDRTKGTIGFILV